jgi:hypothetical protein
LSGALHRAGQRPLAQAVQANRYSDPTSPSIRPWGTHLRHRSEKFLYDFKAGPAGGRLRRPSSAGKHRLNDSAEASTLSAYQPGTSSAMVLRRRRQMTQKAFSRLSGVAAIGGGILLILFAAMAAAKPRGCIGDAECAVRPMRDTSDIDAFALVGLILILIGLAGLVVRVQAAGRLSLLGKVGLVLVALGAATFLLIGTGAVTPSDESMPGFVIPAGAAITIGVILLGITILRSRVLPAWASWLLIIGALATLGQNDEDIRVLLLIPFGVAWLGIGYVLLTSAAPVAKRRATA